jgi:hypothetical protein
VGRDVEGRKLRDYRCLDCSTRFGTVEVVTPMRLYRLDPYRRYRNRLSNRRLKGFRPHVEGGPGQPPRAERRLIVSVKVA